MSRINTNVDPIQAMHRLGSNQQDLSLRLERLSSGLRINRGSDDPAGLIASESLRSEITGINQAIENSTRAVNVIATAEGSLNEVSSLLLDLRGLINKSANEERLFPEEIKANHLRDRLDPGQRRPDRQHHPVQWGQPSLTVGWTIPSPAPKHSDLSDIRVNGANIPEGSK